MRRESAACRASRDRSGGASPAVKADGWRASTPPRGRLPARLRLGAGQLKRARTGQPGIYETDRHRRDVPQARRGLLTHREGAGGDDCLSGRGTLSVDLTDLTDLFGTGGPRVEGRAGKV